MRRNYSLALTSIAILLSISACGATRPAADPPVEDSSTPQTRTLLATPEPLPRAMVVDLVDGNTLVLSLDGSEVAVRLLAIDAPDPARGECFATAASAFVAAVAPPGAVLDLERDTSEADPSGQLARYAFLADGSMLNEQLVRGGFARVAPDAAGTKYLERLQDAQDQARRDGVGLWGECDGTATPTPQAVVAGPPPVATPEATPAAAAAIVSSPPATATSAPTPFPTPTQSPTATPSPSPTPSPTPSPIPSPTATPTPSPSPSPTAAPTTVPTPAPTAAPPPAQNCDPSYPTVCIPPKSLVGDLNCDDIPHRRFTVLPPDPHRFDGNKDGVGCES